MTDMRWSNKSSNYIMYEELENNELTEESKPTLSTIENHVIVLPPDMKIEPVIEAYMIRTNYFVEYLHYDNNGRLDGFMDHKNNMYVLNNEYENRKSICERLYKSMKLIKDNLLVCKNCGQVHDYLTAEEYIDFYENRYRIKRKSIYYRKYHIINTLSDIVQKNNIQLEHYDRESILRIFKLFDRIELPDVGRKRLISVNYIIKQLFDILGIEYKSVPHTRIKNTVKYYIEWWDKVYGYIKDDVNRIILRRHY